MYEVIEKVLEGVTWRVRVIVSPSESMFLWFLVEPGQEDIDRVVDRQLNQRLLDTPVVQEVKLSCSTWQFRKALNATGLRAAVEYAVANSGDQNVIDGWEFANDVERYNPLIVQFSQLLGKTDSEMDALFELARSL
jgi:hypothetical protein